MLAADIFYAVHAIAFSGTLRTTIKHLFQKLVRLEMYIHSKFMLESAVESNSTTERYLLNDFSLLPQSYELREQNFLRFLVLKPQPTV